MTVRTQKDKARFRKSSAWKRFRNRVRKARIVDEVTLHPLKSGWSLHHMNVKSERYADLREDWFAALNKETHRMIHHLYPMFLDDPEVIDRLRDILERMEHINGEK